MEMEETIERVVRELSGTRVPVRACAKVNLRLKLVGRRTDGYHLLSMLNATVDLADEIVVQFLSERALKLVVEPEGVAIGAVEDNLVVRAFRYFWQEIGFSDAPIGLDCFVTKKIPIGAGLGGGSSDAGAMLRVLAATFAGALRASHSISQPQLIAGVMRAAARCGADVSYAFTGGVAWVSGVGEVVEPVALPSPWPGLIAIMVPGESVATAAFYQRLRESRPVISLGADDVRQRFLADPAYGVLPQIVENDFEPEVIQMAPSVGEGLAIARRFFPVGTSVTGSGSAFFSLIPPGHEERLVALERELSEIGIRVIPCRFVL